MWVISEEYFSNPCREPALLWSVMICTPLSCSSSLDTTVTTSSDDDHVLDKAQAPADTYNAPDSTVDEKHLQPKVKEYQPEKTPIKGLISSLIKEQMSENIHESIDQNTEVLNSLYRDIEGVKYDVDGVIEVEKVKVSLLERELWEQFSKLGTEMIITKAGRWVSRVLF